MVTQVYSIYFLLDIVKNAVKIGCSRNVNKRIRKLQTGNSTKLELIYEFKACKQYEKTLHSLFYRLRFGQSEWFDYSTGEIQTWVMKHKNSSKSIDLEPNKFILIEKETNIVDIKNILNEMLDNNISQAEIYKMNFDKTSGRKRYSGLFSLYGFGGNPDIRTLKIGDLKKFINLKYKFIESLDLSKIKNYIKGKKNATTITINDIDYGIPENFQYAYKFAKFLRLLDNDTYNYNKLLKISGLMNKSNYRDWIQEQLKKLDKSSENENQVCLSSSSKQKLFKNKEKIIHKIECISAANIPQEEKSYFVKDLLKEIAS